MKTICMLVRRSLRQHFLSTAVTALSIALAGGLWLSVWAIQDQANSVFTKVNSGFDAVLGVRGSKLQLVLNAIFHVEASPGNLAWEDFQDIQSNRGVVAAIPLAVGDNYRGYRLAGVSSNLFSEIEYQPGRRFEVFPEGRIFDPGKQEAVVGSFAARKLGLEVGDTFHPYHGLTFDPEKQHEETYHVVGILKPSNTPADRVIWIPLAGLQQMSGHDPNAATDISAVLIKVRSPMAGFRLDQLYNKQGDRLTLAWPIGQIMAQLFSKIRWFDRVLELIASLVAVVAAASVLASIHNSMNERRRDIAILRALGARRRTVFGVIILEAVAISVLGMIVAFAVYFAIFAVVASVIRAELGVVLSAVQWHWVMLWAPLLMTGMSALAGLAPAVKAYRTNVAKHLAPVS